MSYQPDVWKLLKCLLLKCCLYNTSQSCRHAQSWSSIVIYGVTFWFSQPLQLADTNSPTAPTKRGEWMNFNKILPAAPPPRSHKQHQDRVFQDNPKLTTATIAPCNFGEEHIAFPNLNSNSSSFRIGKYIIPGDPQEAPSISESTFGTHKNSLISASIQWHLPWITSLIMRSLIWNHDQSLKISHPY